MPNIAKTWYRMAVEKYLETTKYKTMPTDESELEQMATDIRNITNEIIKTENATITDKQEKCQLLKNIHPFQIMKLLLHFDHFILLDLSGKNKNKPNQKENRKGLTLVRYQESGPCAGTYKEDEQYLCNIVTDMNPDLGINDIEEIAHKIRQRVPIMARCNKRNLIAVNNGIFDYDTKQLMPFTPDLVFPSKSAVDYNPNAKNVTIHNEEDGTNWDVESWIAELSDDPEVVELIWQIMGAIIRPMVKWNKAAFFYSQEGNNGKGTLCQLMRNLCGEESCTSTSLDEFCKDFYLEDLMESSAIIADENDVNNYLDSMSTFKALITNDVIKINRKFKTILCVKFYGFVVQCINGLPQTQDKTNSFYRRQLFVPFLKCFTGIERGYIKDDYIYRTEVLEYILYKVLNMNYYELSNPAACNILLDEYKEYNDPILQFINEILPQCKWDLLPYQFLYDLYRSWYMRNVSKNGTPAARERFIQQLKSIVGKRTDWIVKDTQVRVGKRMSKPEELIREYDLDKWYGSARGSSRNDNRTLIPDHIGDRQYGLIRASTPVEDSNDNNDNKE